jgi:hypothetical protein
MGKKRPEQLKALRRKKGDQAKDSAESSVSSAFLDWRTILSAKDVSRLRKAYAIPDDVAIRIPGKNEGATPSPNNREVAVYEAMFKAGLTLQLLPMMRELLTELNLAPSQVKPNAWVLLVSFCILWKTVLGLNEHPSAREFLAFYRPANFGDGWCFQAHRQLIKLHESWHEGDDYEQGFFFISSTCWELSARERYFNTQPSVPVVWGNHARNAIGLLDLFTIRRGLLSRRSASGRQTILTSSVWTSSSTTMKARASSGEAGESTPP